MKRCMECLGLENDDTPRCAQGCVDGWVPADIVVDSRYLVEAKLGAGAMGAVYRARDVGLNRTVAIKTIAPHLARDPAIRQRFQREAHALASVVSPYVVQVFATGRHDDGLYIAMEYVKGVTLDTLIEEHAAHSSFLATSRAIGLLKQIGLGLAAVHRPHRRVGHKALPRAWRGGRPREALRPADARRRRAAHVGARVSGRRQKSVFDRPYPVPANEPARLDALRRAHVLDTPPELAFDDLVQIVAASLGMPMALLTLVDEHRQWFKARVGVELTETPRGLAFCAHAVAQNQDVFIVEVARKDVRFADHPSVTTEPGIRFYAGAPLVTSDGFALGTLCVVDNTPRELTPTQLAVLKALARQAVAQLELRTYTEELRAAHEELRAIDRRKTEFVGTVAHELRTPLTSILGALKLLEAGVVGTLDEQPAELVRIARSNTDRLIRLVNDFLDIERIEANTIELVIEEVSPLSLLEAALEAIQGTADSRARRHLQGPCSPRPTVPCRCSSTFYRTQSNSRPPADASRSEPTKRRPLSFSMSGITVQACLPSRSASSSAAFSG